MFDKLLSKPAGQLGRAAQFLVGQIKLWRHCIRLLRENRAGQQAAALAYYTIFGIVPLAIVTLMIFQLSPAYANTGEKVREFLYRQIHLTQIKYQTAGTENSAAALTEYLDKITDDFFGGLETGKGSITIVSLILVIWAALALLATIEKAFNNIWQVSRPRNILHRVINYWAILTLGPLLIGAGIYLSTQYAPVTEFGRNILRYGGPAVISYLIATVAFFLLYFLLPNTKVKAKPAIWAAGAAALVWSLAKWGFGIYVTQFIPYSQLYGVLGLVPLAIFWIFVSWLIVLFGLQLAFTTQHLAILDAAEMHGEKTRQQNFIADHWTVIAITKIIAEAFEKNRGPLAPEVIAGSLNIPPEFTDKILNTLTTQGLIAKTSEPKVGFLPAKDPANIRLSEISQAVTAAGFAQTAVAQSQKLAEIADAQIDSLAAHSLSEILDR